MADKTCGVHAFVSYGFDWAIENGIEEIDSDGSIFVGLYEGISILQDVGSVQHTPAILFDPTDPEELPYFINRRYARVAGALYPRVAVPLIGMPVQVEHIPQITRGDT